MDAPATLLHARRRAALSQRKLSGRTGIAQSTIARIESGVMEPTVPVLDTLLRACGEQLAVVSLVADGVDRSLIRTCLEMSPRERIETAARAGVFFGRVRGRAREHG